MKQQYSAPIHPDRSCRANFESGMVGRGLTRQGGSTLNDTINQFHLYTWHRVMRLLKYKRGLNAAPDKALYSKMSRSFTFCERLATEPFNFSSVHLITSRHNDSHDGTQQSISEPIMSLSGYLEELFFSLYYLCASAYF